MLDVLRLHHFLLLVASSILSLFPGTSYAQTIAVSTTAAWSSQIVAFWGAIIIAVRSSQREQVTNAISSLTSFFNITIRARKIEQGLVRGNWFLHSGWNNGHIKLDIAMIYWRTPQELRRLARRVALETEVFGDKLEILVLGHKVQESEEAHVHWLRSSRSPLVSGSRVRKTGEPAFPLSYADIVDAIATSYASTSGGKASTNINDVVQRLLTRIVLKGTRAALQGEIPRELNDQAGASWGFIFTGVDHSGESPFITLIRRTGQFGGDRDCTMKCATRMYTVVHLTVCCAIGLMGAASGRGLGVWLMAVKPTLASLGAGNIQGNEVLGSLMALDKSSLYVETADGSRVLAGDMMSPGMSVWQLAAVFTSPCVELVIICAGWLYGAMKVKKLAPTGVVGHGMLCLSTAVSLTLSVRAMVSIRRRLEGRLVGVWRSPHYDRATVGAKSTEISVDALTRSPIYGPSVLGFIATLLREPGQENAFVVECILRTPEAGHLLAQHVAQDVLQFKYSGDTIVSMRGVRGEVKVSGVYPWLQTCCSILFTFLCCCISIVYAYCGLPTWVKLVTEVVSAGSVCWFGTLERGGGGLHHNRDTYISFMIASMLVSSVWYVGVTDVG
ncbi:integral membrane protein [Tricladium varicosporioides]|nr:integral membrane protein [Hymenoscyphus varicosporioides]